jgi:ADP-ribosyl-[dinitrogen reductase] hydrolase
MALHGSCLCGEVKYEVDNLAPEFDHCHCTFCQKAHGAAFGSYATTTPEHFRWTAGHDFLGRYQSSSHSGRIFCKNCGSTLVADIDGGKIIGITLGTLDEDPGIRAGWHMFVRSKAPWYTIADGLPQYAEYPPSMTPFEPTPDKPR